jgi:hypothetical protein
VLLGILVLLVRPFDASPTPCRPKVAVTANEQISRLFDERFYRLRYSDVEQSVRNCGFRSGLDHYLLEGMRQGRDPNLWFSEEYYLRANGDVAQAVQKGSYVSGFDHYIKVGMQEQRDPSPWFSERYYLGRYPEVAQAVRAGNYRSGSDHFARRGLAEGRDPIFWFEETLYRQKYPAVAAAIAAHRTRSGLEYYVLYGRAHGQPPEALSRAAVQRLYGAGVPHTDHQGNVRFRYDSASFFPRCLYHAMTGAFQVIKAAGFNCVHTWEGYGIADVIAELRAAGLQLIKHWPSDAEVRAYAGDPNILAWYLDEEPTAQAYLDTQRSGDSTLQERRYQDFRSRSSAIKAVDARHPIFSLGTAWIPPDLREWWERWNSTGDVTAHDNYCLLSNTTDLEALSRSVPLAVALNHGQKPMWLTLQAFTGTAERNSDLRMPTPAELRGMAFTGIIHGATGLIFFAFDSRVTREGQVLGIAPETPTGYDAFAQATPAEVTQSRSLWWGARDLNAELERLTPELLSPSAGMEYRIYYSGESHTPSPIRSMLKVRKGRYTLLATNIEKQTFGVRFEFATQIVAVKRINPDGSATTIRPLGRAFTDSLGPFGAAVYQIRFQAGAGT